MIDNIDLNSTRNLNPSIGDFNSLSEDNKHKFERDWMKNEDKIFINNASNKRDLKNYSNFFLLIGALSLLTMAGLFGYTYYKEGSLFPEPICAPVIPECPTCPVIPSCPQLNCGNVNITVNTTTPNITIINKINSS